MTVAAKALLVLSGLLGAQASPSAVPLILELSADHPSPEGRTLTLTFRAQGKGDVHFNRAAVELDIRTRAGEPVRYGCADKRDLSDLYDPVLLHPGQRATKFIDTRCYATRRGMSYLVTAVLDDNAEDFRGEAPAGAVWITGPLRSNTLVTPLRDSPR